MSAVSELSQPLLALERANEIRHLRKQLKEDLKSGKKRPDELLCEVPDYAASAPVGGGLPRDQHPDPSQPAAAPTDDQLRPSTRNRPLTGYQAT